MANSAEDAPLDGGSLAGSEEAIIPARPTGGSNSRALKVAGLTTLACLLLASQVFTAFMVFGQKQQIHDLQTKSERMGRQLTRSSKVVAPVRMQMPMNSLPLLMDFPSDEDTKTPKTPTPAKLQDTVASVEKQVKELIQEDFRLPPFNKTFIANLQSLKNEMNETEWQSFESWMRYWLIFQMAQQQPAPPKAGPGFSIKTKCQEEAGPGPSKIGSFKPQCDEQGRFKPMQCWHATGFCWCVDSVTGTPVEGTSMRGYPDCQKGTSPRRLMLAPSLMQRAVSIDDDQ